MLLLGFTSRGLFAGCARHDTGFLIIADALFKEIGLAGQGDGLHEVEGISRIVEFRVAEGDQQPIGDEFNVLLHQRGVHAQQRAGQGLGQEFLLDGHGFGDDVLHGLFAGTVVQVGEEEAGKIGVEAFVARDEFVGKG